MKKILIFVLLLLLTGCDVKYDLTITNKEKVIEEFKVYIDNEQIKEENSDIKDYLNYYANLYKSNQGYERFKISTKKSNPQSYFKISNSYSSLDSYISSLSYKSMFNSATIERVGDYITFTSSANAYLQNIKNDEIISEDSKYDSFKISIKFYNEVTSSNAEEVDKNNNIYTWIVSEDSATDYIYFRIGPKVKYNVIIKDYIKNNLAGIVVITSTIVLLSGIILYIVIKSKKNNEV